MIQFSTLYLHELLVRVEQFLADDSIFNTLPSWTPR